MSIFFVDSTSELTNEQTKKLGIERIDIPFLFDGREVSMDENYDFDKYYSKFKKGINFETCSLDKNIFIDAFEPVLQQNDDVLYVYQSSNIYDDSSLFDAKDQLLQLYPNLRIELIDSRSFSIGYGVIAYLLALKYRNGANLDEIIEYAENLKKEYSTFLLLDSIEKMEQKKLISENNIVSSVLSIKPIISIDRDGQFVLFDKTSGKKKAIAKLISIIRQIGENVADFPIGIVYSNNISDAEEIKSKIIEYFGNDVTILMQRLTPNNASILGIGVLGISFHTHKKL